jgi:hypothetical protein
MVTRLGIILMALLIFASLGSSQNLTSTFDLRGDGWSTEGGANVSWMERGGNPGGFLLGEDTEENCTWRYVSPEPWSGNWTPHIGDNLSFDIRLIDDGDGVNLNFDDILKIYGRNGTSVAWPGLIAPWPGEPARGVWTHYEIALVPSSFGVNESDFLEVMEDVENISIRGEYSDGRDQEGLDNVIVVPPQARIPEWPIIVHHDGGDVIIKLETPPETPLEPEIEPEPFYWRNNTTKSGYNYSGGSGDGSSRSSNQGERIMLYCEDTGAGNHWATGAVWNEFTYDREDHLCKVALKCHVKGGMAVAGVPDVGGLFGMPLFTNSVDLKVYMILQDLTEGFVVEKVLIHSTTSKDDAFLNEIVDEWPTGEIEAELMKDHEYQLKLEAAASSSTVGLSSLIVDFSGSNPEEHIKWSYGEVKWI